jgi:hypothetical protein
MSNTHEPGRRRAPASKPKENHRQAAAAAILDYASNRQASDMGDQRGLVTFLRSIASQGGAAASSDQVELVLGFFRDVLDAEGTAALEGYATDGWARELFRKQKFYRRIERHYNSCIEDGDAQPDGIDRTESAWNQIVRRNVTLPQGIVFEVEAVRKRLAEGGTQKISFSGLIEVALRELFERPVDEDDSRFFEEELGRFEFDPVDDLRAIAEIVSSSPVGARRASVASEGGD